MRALSDYQLVKAYKKAIEFKLDRDFQLMLENEIIRRKKKMSSNRNSWIHQKLEE